MDPFSQVFAQVKEWLTLELHGIIIMLHVVAFPMDYILICDQCQQGGVLKPTENDHFQIFLAVWVLIPKFLGVTYVKTT